jgi:uroporphyrinogen III methyltransferase/synthase
MSVLTGKRILVTRPRAQAAAFIESLIRLGAQPVIFPTIEIAGPENEAALDRAILGLRGYRWVIFTSVNGVASFWKRLGELGLSNENFTGVQVAAIGPATAEALRERGIEPDFIPGEYVAEAIVPGLGEVQGQRILLPRADIARKALVDALVQHGALPDEIAVYRTVVPQANPQAMRDLEQGVDIATFTSSSTVRNFYQMLGEERASELLRGAVIACIGPVTARTAQALGLRVDIVADEYTVDGLVKALLDNEKMITRNQE